MFIPSHKLGQKNVLHKLRLGLALLTVSLISMQPSTLFAKEVKSMPAPKVIIFDVNETLLDLAPLKTAVGKALNGREELLPLWFSTMLHYSLVDTLTNNYHDFGQVGVAALMMTAENQGIKLEAEVARKTISSTITKLPAYADVEPSMKKLSAAKYRLVSLTNSSNAGVAAQLEFAGLTQYIERRFSIEDLKAFKPDPRTYTWALKELGIKPEEALMVAAHAWDLAGAKAVGLQTAFIHRPGTTLYPNASRPDYIVENLTELTDQLLEKY